ncbi:hypothetical protein [Zobellia alginiliquefaciens]|uniref:hypothetical protein n=1 Tax=Zobellia alginiliquefaciens TaxID=3032586 RepID=UPI0023E38DB3|nr:hypothetical protein [Zobellia alginiliquefaciens]
MEHEKYFQYFDRAVLNYYRANSHAYHLIEDDMGGEIRISDNWDENLSEEHPYIEFKFAFRKLENNFVCIAAFMPSFKDKISEKDHAKWIAFYIKNPSFHKVNKGFERWTKRYLDGSWDVMDGPKIGIQRELKLINSITETKLNHKLFKQDEYRLVNYPAAENSEEYTKSILELYRLVIDGIEKNCLIKIAKEQNITLKDEGKRLNSFKEIIPSNLQSEIYTPFHKINRKRMPIHGIPSKGITPYAAFETFNSDLEDIFSALKELKNLFEIVFDLDSESCLQRLESLSIFPKFDKPPRPEFKLEEALKMKGKTIESIEFGETKFHKDVHAGEGINIYFTDGTAVSLQIGSNAYNIASKYNEINPPDIHTDIMLFWAEKLRKKNEKK